MVQGQFCYKCQKTKAGDVLPSTAQLEADLSYIMCRCEGKCEGFLTLHLSFILCVKTWDQDGYKSCSACNENIDVSPKKLNFIRKQQLGSLVGQCTSKAAQTAKYSLYLLVRQ